jgi:hypothetical protein
MPILRRADWCVNPLLCAERAVELSTRAVRGMVSLPWGIHCAGLQEHKRWR